MLTFTIFAPLATGLLVLLIPAHRWRAIRLVTLAGALATLTASLAMAAGTSWTGLSHRTVLPWIAAIGASYDVAVDGLSLPLVVLTAVLLCAVAIHALDHRDRAKGHAFLFLLMSTGLIGVFASQDLLLFYVFFEIALVPMYFIVGLWGHERRRYAAMKFFLYTRAGSLAMLLAFLALALPAHTFSIEELARTAPTGGLAAGARALALLGLVLGFGVKLPTVPLHNWLPDAHVEAPTEGSVMLAGIQLKMGGYGLLRIALPLLPDALRTWAWLVLALGLISMVYGALAALAQRDFKRMVAYTSINHMGYVLAAVAAAAVSPDAGVRQLAVAGALFQMVSHGLLTGGMFFLAGMLQDSRGTRDITKVGGLFQSMPRWSGLLVILAFGSLGLPGLSGFAAEFQVIGAVLSVHWWAAAVIVLGLAITTGLYVRAVSLLTMGEPQAGAPGQDPPAGKLGVVAALAALSVLLGVAPSIITSRVMAPPVQRGPGR